MPDGSVTLTQEISKAVCDLVAQLRRRRQELLIHHRRTPAGENEFRVRQHRGIRRDRLAVLRRRVNVNEAGNVPAFVGSVDQVEAWLIEDVEATRSLHSSAMVIGRTAPGEINFITSDAFGHFSIDASSIILPASSMAMEHSTPKPRVSLHDIARRVHVSQPTVSRALKDDPRISVATRQKVHRAAREMGYQPDPMLTALAHYRRGKTMTPVSSSLAWINLWRGPKLLRSFREFELYWQGAAAD